MRKCPQCGFLDPRQWKHCKYSYHIDGISRENFAILYPVLASKLKRGGDLIDDKDNVYRLVKTELVVERKAKVDFFKPFNGTSKSFHYEPYEKGSRQKRSNLPFIKSPHDARGNWSKLHPNQTKLTIFGLEVIIDKNNVD